MLAEHVAIAERIQREVDEICFVAKEKRRVFVDQVIERLRRDLGPAVERDRRLPGAAEATSSHHSVSVS